MLTRAIVNRNMPAEMPTKPKATATLAPKRAANFGEFGATSIITAANGSCLRPASNGAVAEHQLEVLRHEEEEPEHREEDEGDDAGGDTESRIEEVAQVQHRRGVAQLPHQERGDDHDRNAEPQQARPLAQPRSGASMIA